MNAIKLLELFNLKLSNIYFKYSTLMNVKLSFLSFSLIPPSRYPSFLFLRPLFSQNHGKWINNAKRGGNNSQEPTPFEKSGSSEAYSIGEPKQTSAQFIRSISLWSWEQNRMKIGEDCVVHYLGPLLDVYMETCTLEVNTGTENKNCKFPKFFSWTPIN